MSVLEQYRYEGGIRPDFKELPTEVTPDEEFMIERGAAEAVVALTETKPEEIKSEAAAASAEIESEVAEAPAETDPEVAAASAETAPGVAAAESAESEQPVETENSAEKPAKKQEDPIRAFLKEKAGANLVEIGRLQKALHSAKKSALIIILHGMPYSGRTETGHYLKKGMKKGVKLYSYKKGCHSHDFLWQMHRRTPKYGNICIMSNSVYADIPSEEGGAEKVRAFEKYLRESGVAVVRIFLNVSPKQQKNRMLEVITTKPGGSPREIPQEKGWRKVFLEEFADVVEAATPETPWYILPADNKWYARCLVTEIVRDALRECVTVQDEPAPTGERAEAAVASAEEKAEEAEASVEEKAEEAAASAEEKAEEAAVAPAEEKLETAEPVKKPARRTRRKKAETPTEDVKADVETDTKTDTKSADAAPAKKTTTRRPRRQGPPKTVEETLARRRKRMEDSEG